LRQPLIALCNVSVRSGEHIKREKALGTVLRAGRKEDALNQPSWLFGGAGLLGPTAAKAALMYVTALLGLRVAHRRTLAQWTAIDFAAAVAVGAIVGRTAVASTQPLLVGVVALGTILAAHAAVTFGRYLPWVSKLTDHRVRVLVEHGELRRRELLVCGLTESDLYAHLRQQGVQSLRGLRFVLYEAKGDLTLVPEDAGTQDGDDAVVAQGLREAAGR
jgi:uncharacterized membrane protein YcaP (DUF421 family)